MCNIDKTITVYGCVLLAFVGISIAGIPLKQYEAIMKQQSAELGLYNSSDKVIILTSANFNETVLHQNRSTLVEFYNSYCGHCKRFAPHYKQLAAQLYDWRDILPICALDCAAEENNDICREYEIMAYPSVRYFSPNYMPSAQNYGHGIYEQNIDEIRTLISQFLANENNTMNIPNWPNLQNLTESEAAAPFDGLDSRRQLVIVVYEPENTTIGIESILHFIRWPTISVRRVTDPNIASKFYLNAEKYKLATVNRQGKTERYAPINQTSQSYVETIKSILHAQGVTESPVSETTAKSIGNNAALDNLQYTIENNAVIAEVKRNKHFVYQADLEMAIRTVIFNEISKTANISSEKLLALQRFLAVLQRYNPLGAHGRAFIKDLYEYVMQFNQELNGKDLENELLHLEAKHTPIFSSNRFIGCTGSHAGLRGFTCSLWQLFHFMTVQAAINEFSQDPIEVLQAMHGYVKFFFGCTDCAAHFQSMATRRKIWSTPNKDEAVLWLWAAHNEVNQRLSGDATEDAQFPKIQFPSQSSCSQCYKQLVMSPANLDINWDKDAVFNFLKNIYNPEYISRYGVQREDLLYPTVEKLRRKRMIGNVFSDMDMRMGMMLYGFCIVMMVVAFKLFAFKGYRKKPYGHDILGKV